MALFPYAQCSGISLASPGVGGPSRGGWGGAVINSIICDHGNTYIEGTQPLPPDIHFNFFFKTKRTNIYYLKMRFY